MNRKDLDLIATSWLWKMMRLVTPTIHRLSPPMDASWSISSLKPQRFLSNQIPPQFLSVNANKDAFN